jgi:hypothetical protein
MHAVSHKPWFKAISLVLVVAFICLDISWAQPANVSGTAQKLSAELPFQSEIMDEGKADFRQSLFSDIKLLASIKTIAKYILEEKHPLSYMQSVITKEIGDIAERIDLSRVTVKDNVVSIPLERGDEISLIQIAKKDSLSPAEVSDGEWIESGKYVIRKKVVTEKRVIAEPDETIEKHEDRIPPSGSDIHDLTARSCLRAAWVTGVLTGAFVIALTTFYMISGMTDGMILLSEFISLLALYVTSYYLLLGLDIRRSLVEWGVPKDEAMDMPIASSNGYMHKAYSKLARSHQYAVDRHEIFPHMIGMILITPLALILYPLYVFRLKRFDRLSSQYAGIYYNNPESMYEYAQLEFPQIRAFALERAWKLDNIDKIGRLFVLSYGRDDELTEAAITRLFQLGAPEKIKEHVKKCLMGFTDSYFDIVELKSFIPRRSIRDSMTAVLADQLTAYVNTRADFEKVAAIIDHHYDPNNRPRIKELEDMAKIPGEIDKLFLGEKIFARFGSIRRPGEAQVDPKYERGASYRLARAAAELYGTSSLSQGELEDVIAATREVVAFYKARTPAYKYVDDLASDPKSLRRSIQAQGGLFRTVKNDEAEKARAELQFDAPINNTRSSFVEACNDMVAILAGRTNIFKVLEGTETTTEVVDLAEQLLGDLEKMRTDGRAPLLFSKEVVKVEDVLRKNLRTFEAEGIIASIITLARQAKRDGKKFIIGIETGWIPGIEKATMQHMAINPLVTEIKSLGKTLKSMGLDNVVIVHDKREYLAHNILWETSKREGASADYSNVLVLASAETIASKVFDPLRSTEGQKKAFLAGIDASQLRDFSEKNENDYEQVRVRLMEMFSLALELAAGKTVPDLPIIKEYNEALRTVIFLPKAEPMDFKELQKLYRNQQIALQAA